MKARLATLLVLAAVAGCGGDEAAPTQTEAGGNNPTSTIGDSAIAGAPEGLERTQPPKVPGVPEHAADALFSVQPVVKGWATTARARSGACG